MDLAWLRRRAGEPGGVESPIVLEKVTALTKMTDEIIGQVRHISAELRPGVLDDLGLSAAIEWQAQAFEQRTGTVCAVRSELGDERLDNQVSTAVFRIFQEALTNVGRHAGADHVDVVLRCTDGFLALDVLDDGCGIAPESARGLKSLGLLGMRERARRFGGTLSVEPGPEGGTALSLRIPLNGGRS
jgi:signal transduction histidine kinase